jgi:dipeptidyl aminopeptidase/acylaminoacyl peptidase
MGLNRQALIPIGIAAAAADAYSLACVRVYGRLTRVPRGCRLEWLTNSPSGFVVPTDEPFDATPYSMPEPETVWLPSRDADVTISGWWIPAAAGAANAPAVIVVHGLTACKHDHAVLLPAGMLYRNGFSVLLIDLRDHGESTPVDGRHAGGTDEYADVLGAWDWLRRVQKVPAERIGALGISLGAATVLIALGEEPRIAATWADSSYGESRVAIRAELERAGYPTILEWGGLAIAVLLTGDGLLARSPLDAVRRLDGRALFLTHGARDERLSVRYAYDLAAEIEANGGHVVPWIVPGARHTEAMVLVPDEYERRLVEFFGESLGAAASPAPGA